MWIYVNVYSPGFNGLTDGTYIYKPRSTDKNDPSLADVQWFKKGKVAVDLNNDGEIESKDDEYLDITGGTIKVKVTGDEYTIDFNVKLENRETAVGSIKDDFDQIGKEDR